jgi:hypothetical protein
VYPLLGLIVTDPGGRKAVAGARLELVFPGALIE